ncbi:peptidoglycan recognition protein family protein [Salimicrobium halophilum]|uniref:Autolysin n=1 Tax=Salimicrobium halophilum TaxID=86666 RepID=A0A1G8WCF8_9BACI|nr:peptidoglycan recognition family protein [Salimicrobium halophilum]SDJ75922.1 N-acetylmuramoyl-L-alanine amidase [Salimicrobium halophilum]
MPFSFESLPQLENVRPDLPHDGRNPTNSTAAKTDIAIHHSLTDGGDAFSFARFHTNPKPKGQGWPEVAYHFVIEKDGTIQWCHHPRVIGYHVGNSNSFALGICLVGDFRDTEPTDAQKQSLYDLHKCLVKDLPNYKRTRGHDEFPGYSWKPCPEFDYEAVINRATAVKGVSTAEKVKKGEKQKMYKPSNEAIKNSTARVLRRLEQKGEPSISSVHREKLEKGELLESDAIGLLYVGLDRELIQGSD